MASHTPTPRKRFVKSGPFAEVCKRTLTVSSGWPTITQAAPLREPMSMLCHKGSESLAKKLSPPSFAVSLIACPRANACSCPFQPCLNVPISITSSAPPNLSVAVQTEDCELVAGLRQGLLQPTGSSGAVGLSADSSWREAFPSARGGKDGSREGLQRMESWKWHGRALHNSTLKTIIDHRRAKIACEKLWRELEVTSSPVAPLCSSPPSPSAVRSTWPACLDPAHPRPPASTTTPTPMPFGGLSYRHDSGRPSFRLRSATLSGTGGPLTRSGSTLTNASSSCLYCPSLRPLPRVSRYSRSLPAFSVMCTG